MRGTYSDAGTELIQDTWVQQPAGYEMVDLRSGPLADGDTSLAGEVITDGCTTFSLERDTHSPRAGAHKGSGTAVAGAVVISLVVGGLLYMIGAFGMGDSHRSRSRGSGGLSDVERLESGGGSDYIDPTTDPRFWDKNYPY